jgi:ankyrin repeat protein
VQLLLDRVPSLAKAADNGGRTALHQAAIAVHTEVVKSLLDRVPTLSAFHDNEGLSALDVAQDCQQSDVVQLLSHRR